MCFENKNIGVKIMDEVPYQSIPLIILIKPSDLILITLSLSAGRR
jgi:hypothetical protein